MKEKTTRRAKRKLYEPPKLIEYGTLSQLTQVKGGNAADGGGKPTTKLSGRSA